MKEIPLTRGLVAIVDDEDFDRVSKNKWFAHSAGYANRHIKTGTNKWSTETMHRFLLGLKKGDKQCVDHINGNKLDNRKYNLRICSQSKNSRNKKINKNNTSGFKGVHFIKSRGKFIASIMIDRKHINLGFFSSSELAYKAYCDASLKYHGDFANNGHGSILLTKDVKI